MNRNKSSFLNSKVWSCSLLLLDVLHVAREAALLRPLRLGLRLLGLLNEAGAERRHEQWRRRARLLGAVRAGEERELACEPGGERQVGALRFLVRRRAEEVVRVLDDLELGELERGGLVVLLGLVHVGGDQVHERGL